MPLMALSCNSADAKRCGGWVVALLGKDHSDVCLIQTEERSERYVQVCSAKMHLFKLQKKMEQAKQNWNKFMPFMFSLFLPLHLEMNALRLCVR